MPLDPMNLWVQGQQRTMQLTNEKMRSKVQFSSVTEFMFHAVLYNNIMTATLSLGNL